MEYLVVYEESESGIAAFVPDLPGCVASGDSYDHTKKLIKEAILFHIEGLQLEGLPLPRPTSTMAEKLAV